MAACQKIYKKISSNYTTLNGKSSKALALCIVSWPSQLLKLIAGGIENLTFRTNIWSLCRWESAPTSPKLSVLTTLQWEKQCKLTYLFLEACKFNCVQSPLLSSTNTGNFLRPPTWFGHFPTKANVQCSRWERVNCGYLQHPWEHNPSSKSQMEYRTVTKVVCRQTQQELKDLNQRVVIIPPGKFLNNRLFCHTVIKA